MTLGVNSLSQLSNSNPLAPIRKADAPAPAAPAQQAAAPSVATRIQQQPQGPAPHAGAQLTTQEAITNFEHQLSGLGVPELQQQVEAVAGQTQLAGFLDHVLGKEPVGAEVHGALAVGGGYAGNTIGGICEVFKDPTVLDTNDPNKYDVSGQVTKDTTEKWLISGNNRTDDAGTALNEGAKVAAAFGIFVSALGLYNSGKQGIQGLEGRSVAAEFELRGTNRAVTADLLDRMALGGAEQLTGPEQVTLRDNLQNLNDLLDTGLRDDKLAPDARQYMQISLARIKAVHDNMPNPDPEAMQNLAQHLKADAAALKNLSTITRDEANLNILQGTVGVLGNLNGLANGGLTIMSIVHSTGTTLGNQAAQGLIFTQAFSGVGMIATGAIGAYQDHKAIKKSEQRLARLTDYESHRPAIAAGPGQAKAIQEREEVADVGKLVKKESDNIIKTRWWSRLKNFATVAAGVALTIGVCVAAAAFVASPIGWAVGGLAAVAGIGIAGYRLYKKHQQQNSINTLDQQQQRVSTEVKTLTRDRDALRANPDVVRARNETADYTRLKQEVRQDRAQITGLDREYVQISTSRNQVDRQLDTAMGLLERNNTLRNPTEGPAPIGAALRSLEDERGQIMTQIEGLQRQRLDQSERMIEIDGAIQTARGRIRVASGQIDDMHPRQQLLKQLTDIEGALPAREQLQSQIEGRLRQVSPDHATRDLVRLIQSGNSDAKDFAHTVLQIPREALEGAAPAIQAELIRKNIATAYL